MGDQFVCRRFEVSDGGCRGDLARVKKQVVFRFGVGSVREDEVMLHLKLKRVRPSLPDFRSGADALIDFAKFQKSFTCNSKD